MDNQSAINMINACIPTMHSWHIDIQHFAIKDWKDAGNIIMAFIPGILNPLDDLAKPLGWVLNEYPACCIMGHYFFVLFSFLCVYLISTGVVDVIFYVYFDQLFSVLHLLPMIDGLTESSLWFLGLKQGRVLVVVFGCWTDHMHEV